MSIRTTFFAFTVFALTGCPTVVDDTDDTDDTDTPVTIDSDLVGTWVSEGADVAPLLAANDVVRVDATFEMDGSYVVTSTDSASSTVDFAGTFTVDESTTPATIVLTQTSPYNATADGIWQIDAGVLSYEVVQAGLGFTAPTPTSGFGSTSGPGLSPDDNLQIFR
ncbi:MAG: hypothetical protein R3F61_14200 [Myxococcota bacterium]